MCLAQKRNLGSSSACLRCCLVKDRTILESFSANTKMRSVSSELCSIGVHIRFAKQSAWLASVVIFRFVMSEEDLNRLEPEMNIRLYKSGR